MTGNMKFKRTHDIEMDMNDDQTITISSSLHDMLEGEVMHDLELKMVISKDTAEIISIDGKIHTPDYLNCQEALEGLRDLEGMNFAKGFKKVVLSLMGGVKGCFHFNNMLVQVGASAMVSRVFKTKEGIKKYKDWVKRCKKNPDSVADNIEYRLQQVPELTNTCHVCRYR
ncbi:MAG: DUF2889 domain-containing protein [Desulfatiglans sp.]|nr:DUF2889 domain-containing protein [Thermodesulfobacteriota bacterium]MEE4352874.1 DUF2889 domain-containing protein [Desulfatiglans sp.]